MEARRKLRERGFRAGNDMLMQTTVAPRRLGGAPGQCSATHRKDARRQWIVNSFMEAIHRISRQFAAVVVSLLNMWIQ